MEASKFRVENFCLVKSQTWLGSGWGEQEEGMPVMTTKQSLLIRSQRLHFNLSSPAHPLIHPPIHLSTHPSICPSVHPSIFHPSANYVPIMCQALFWALSHKQRQKQSQNPKVSASWACSFQQGSWTNIDR